MQANHKYFHWLYFAKNKKHFFNWGTALFIWLFLGITRPFGISQHDFESYLLLLSNLLIFGAIWLVVSYPLDLIFKNKIERNHVYDLKVMGLKVFVLIHVFLITRGSSCNWHCIDLFEYLELWLACCIMVGICYLTFSLYGRYLFFHSLVGKGDPEPGLLRITGNGKDKVLLSEKDLIFIKSDDNYVDFECNESRQTIRATLSSVENQLKSYPSFVRVHRSYIVNLKYAEDLPKRDTLRIRHKDEILDFPVSRKYQSSLAQIFNHPK